MSNARYREEKAGCGAGSLLVAKFGRHVSAAAIPAFFTDKHRVVIAATRLRDSLRRTGFIIHKTPQEAQSGLPRLRRILSSPRPKFCSRNAGRELAAEN